MTGPLIHEECVAMASESLQWPLVGRERELKTILDHLRIGRTPIVLTGPGGIGKSALAEVTLHELMRLGWSIVRVTGSPAGRSIPYAAISHLLPSTMPSRVINPLRWAADELTRGGRRRAFLVEDAHLLDDATATVVNNLVVHRRVTVLVTMRDDGDASNPVTDLIKWGGAAPVPVGPLSDADIAVLLRAALEGPVDDLTICKLSAITEGNALLLREVVDAARNSGALQGPPWRLVGPVPTDTSTLTDLIAARIGTVDQSEADVLDYLALAEPLSIAILESICPIEAIERCQQRKLIRLEPDGQAWLIHPLYAEALRAPHRTLAVRRRYRILVETVQRSTAGFREQLRLPIWQLEAGMDPDSASLLDGARIAWAAHDYHNAHRLAAAAAQDRTNVEASILLATVLNHTYQIDKAASVLAAITDIGHLPERERVDLALTRAFNLSLQPGRLGEAVAVLEVAQQEVMESEYRQDLEVLRIHLTIQSGDLHHASERARSLLAAGPASPAIHAQVLSFVAALSGIEGRFLDSMSAARAALATIDTWREAVPVIVAQLHANWFSSSLLAGDLGQAEIALSRLGAETVGQSDWVALDTAVHAMRARLLRLRGRLRDAAIEVDSSTAGPMGPEAQSERAICLALMGDSEGARGALTVARQLSERWPPFPQIRHTIAMASATVEATIGNVGHAADIAQEVAAQAVNSGMPSFSIQALHAATSFGAASQITDRLAALTSQTQGELCPLFARQACAVAKRDSGALMSVADRYAALGYLIDGAEAAAQAHAAICHTAGDGSPAARKAAARAAVLIEQCQQLKSSAVTTLHAPQLSERERHVATLAAQGLSSRQIAERLSLSVRTVDNHLQHAYAKLGVSSRTELSELL